mgnify:CR=1 FL=1
MEKFKIRMAAARMNADMNQQEMADALGIDRVTYLKYEKGDSIMRMDLAYKFSELVNIPMEHIDFLWPKNAT